MEKRSLTLLWSIGVAMGLFAMVFILSACVAIKGASLSDNEAISLIEDRVLQSAMPYIDGDFIGDVSLDVKGVKADQEAKSAAEDFFAEVLREAEETGSRKLYPFGCAVEYESASVSAESKIACLYEYSDTSKEWYLLDYRVYTSDAYPNSGVSDEALSEAISTFMLKIDNENASYDERLSDIYSHDRELSVTKNEFHSTGSTPSVDFVIHIVARNGVVKHEGDVSGSLVWRSEIGLAGWSIEQVNASSDAYVADYSDLVGTWTGTRIGPDMSDSQGNCLGGSSNPPTLVVSSVDNTAHVMTVDVEFLAHYHETNDNVQENTEGDAMESLTSAIFPIDTEYQTAEYTCAYEAYNREKYTISLTFNADSTITMHVHFNHYDDPDAFATHVRYFNDTYTLTKAE